MESVNQSMNRSAMVVSVMVEKFPKFRKIVSNCINKSTQDTTLFENFIGAKYFKITREDNNLVNNGYNNSCKNHTSFTDSKGDIHFVLYESIFKTEIVFAKGDTKGMDLYNAYFAMITVPSKESAKMFKEALEAY